jgi:hypothetical protein
VGNAGSVGKSRGVNPLDFSFRLRNTARSKLSSKKKEKQSTRNSEVGKDYASHLTFFFGLVELSWWNYVAVKLSEIRLRTEAKPRIFSTTVPRPA